jgi:hypothetical protein
MKKQNVYGLLGVCVAVLMAAGNAFAAADEVSRNVDELLLDIEVVTASEEVASAAIDNPAALRGKVNAQIAALNARKAYGGDDTEESPQEGEGRGHSLDSHMVVKEDLFRTITQRVHDKLDGNVRFDAGDNFGFDKHGVGSFDDNEATPE